MRAITPACLHTSTNSLIRPFVTYRVEPEVHILKGNNNSQLRLKGLKDCSWGIFCGAQAHLHSTGLK